jgi:hypothetical protein
VTVDWSEEDPPIHEKVALLKTMVNIVEVAELLGLEPDHQLKTFSPYHDENTASCQLYEPDHFFDYSTGRGGDAIDLVIAVRGCSWGSAVYQLWTRGLRAGFEPGRHQAVARPEASDLWSVWMDVPAPPDVTTNLDYWASKLGVEFDLVQALWAGGYIRFPGGDEIWIAHWQNDGEKPVVRGIKTRDRSGQKGSVTGSQYTHGLYSSKLGGFPSVPVAVITEGESDCWVLSWLWRDDPIDVFALPSGAGLWRAEWLEQLAPYRIVYTAFDNDQAGKQATDKVARSIGYGRTSQLTVPSLYNDVREAFIAGWRPEAKKLLG